MTVELAALDFETYYTKEYSVGTLGVHGYVNDDRFLATIAAVAWANETVLAASPDKFPWESLHGIDLVSHNRQFDRLVFERLQRGGVIPAHVQPRRWYCSMACARYLNYPASLREVSNYLLGWAPDKDQRKNMLGRSTPTAEDFEYAKSDARACLGIFLQIEHRWPDHERRLADLTEAMGDRGITVDRPKVEAIIADLEVAIGELAISLPWGPERRGITSIKKFNEACGGLGVPPPPTTSRKAPELKQWITEQQMSEDGAKAVAYLDAIAKIRSYSRVGKTLETILNGPSGNLVARAVNRPAFRIFVHDGKRSEIALQ